MSLLMVPRFPLPRFQSPLLGNVLSAPWDHDTQFSFTVYYGLH